MLFKSVKGGKEKYVFILSFIINNYLFAFFFNGYEVLPGIPWG